MNGQTLEEEVNIPKHYRSHESGIEAIEITRYLDFSAGNLWKYAMRYRDKQTPKKDLMKCMWYLNDFIQYQFDNNGIMNTNMNISKDVYAKMDKVIEFEPDNTIKSVFLFVKNAFMEKSYSKIVRDVVKEALTKKIDTFN